MKANKLTPAEEERLAVLIEEFGEVLRIAGKILRHGYVAEHAGIVYDNRAEFVKELGDVQSIMHLMRNKGDVRGYDVDSRSDQKALERPQYMHYVENR